MMEFCEKLQLLRKQNGLTQEELAQSLYVSRTAISKWESGRGYPNIDSLKAISRFFSVTIDELLSGEEVLTIATEEHKQKEKGFINLAYGLLDCSMAMFFWLPLFVRQTDRTVQAVSLLSLTGIQPYIKAVYLIVVIAAVMLGMTAITLQNVHWVFWAKHKSHFSLLCNMSSALLFIIGRQTYAAAFSFIFLLIKAWLLYKHH